MDARSRRPPEPKPSSVLKAKAAAAEKKVEDYADDDDDSLEEEEEEEENYGGEFGISSEKCVKKKKKKVVFGGGSGKKGSGGGGGGGMLPPRCQAEKCDADLTDAKRYHRRHKVCELHAKAPAAIVAGLRQRFCQQCSRFHVLSEFDDTKRSCRRRLAGHNERRRKSSSESHGGEGCSGQSSGLQLNENHCRQADDRGGIRTMVPFPGNPIYKQFHIK